MTVSLISFENIVSSLVLNLVIIDICANFTITVVVLAYFQCHEDNAGLGILLTSEYSITTSEQSPGDVKLELEFDFKGSLLPIT